MNENRFTSQRTHTRVKFQPLTTSCHLSCLTAQSPAAQTINALGGAPAYEPDRTLTPTAIFPDVRASDPDGVFHHGPANAYLSLDTLEWLVDGEPIAERWTAGTDYAVDTTEGDTRGTLRVMKNLPASEKAVLRFRGEFLDWRTGIVYTVESDDLALTCTDKGADVLACSVDKPGIVYDPLYDGLLLYDYKVARGLPVAGTRESHVDGKCYEQSVHVVLTSGTSELTALPADVSMRVVRLGTDAALTPGSEASPELLRATFPTVAFDMRLIERGEYEVQFVRGGATVCRASVGLHTKATMPSGGQGLRGADLAASQQVYANTAIVNLGDRQVDYPELYYLIRWFTQAQYNDGGVWKYAAAREWQRGEGMQAAVGDLGLGVTKNDSWFDYWFECEAHGARGLCADEEGDVLADEDGELLID